MHDTVKARYEFHVHRHMIDTDANYWILYDGPEPLFVAQRRSYEDFCEKFDFNEETHTVEVFTTRKGNQFIYWYDAKIGADCLSIAPQ